MSIHSQTLKISLETLIEQHGLAEVLDRLADITHTSHHPNSSQITNLLEQATKLSLVYPSTPLSIRQVAHN